MHNRQLVGFVLLPLALLAMTWFALSTDFWSAGGSILVPRIATAMAFALMIVGATCVLLGVEPAQIPAPVAVCVAGSIPVVHAAGLVVDNYSYGLAGDMIEAGVEWAGFALILIGALLLPRVMDRPHGKTRCRMCDYILRGLMEPRCPECGEAI